MLQALFQAMAVNMSVIWVLLFLCPTYLVVATLLSKFLVFFHHLLKTQPNHYLGDVSWLVPLKSQEDLKAVNILLIANLMALLSILFVFLSVFHSYQEEQQSALKKKYSLIQNKKDQ